MPAATTHYLFSLEAYKLLNEETREKITNKNMFYLGSQGPDFLFFHNAGLGDKCISYIGNLLHDKKCFDAIDCLYEHSKDDSDLLSYFYGFLTHYALDSNVHPLVNYDARYFKNESEDEGINHFRIESYIDTYMLAKLNLNKKKDYDVYKKIKIDKNSLSKLSSMYQKVIKKIYNRDVPAEKFAKAINDTSLYLGIMKPDFKIKYYAIKAIEKIKFNGKAKITSMMLYNEQLPRKHEIMNFDHKEYFVINDKSIKHHNSFDDCYQNALNTYLNITNNPKNKDLFKLNFEGEVYE